MIAFISGRVIATLDSQIIVKTPTGIGYLVQISPNQSFMVNENLDLFILHIVREDKQDLFGFKTLEERKWVENLLKVDGVGPKSAALIVYTLGVDKLKQGIEDENSTLLTEVKGLGVKTAKKIVLELKGSRVDINRLQNQEKNSEFAINFTDTLSGLGYKRGEIVSLISKLKKEKLWDEENPVTTIKKGLEKIGKK